jgi:hypothetical protein
MHFLQLKIFQNPPWSGVTSRALYHEVHSANVTGPWPHGDRFIVGFQYDVTNKPSGKRMKLDEVGLYTVSKGKIVREEFFYDQ